jgi:hypothetical protein
MSFFAFRNAIFIDFPFELNKNIFEESNYLVLHLLKRIEEQDPLTLRAPNSVTLGSEEAPELGDDDTIAAGTNS